MNYREKYHPTVNSEAVHYTSLSPGNLDLMHTAEEGSLHLNARRASKSRVHQHRVAKEIGKPRRLVSSVSKLCPRLLGTVEKQSSPPAR